VDGEPRLTSAAAAALLVAALGGCGGPGASEPATPESLAASWGFGESEFRRAMRLSPLPAYAGDPTNRFERDPAAAELGHHLFFETRLSGSGTVSCATCHDPALAFTDRREVAEGLGRGTRNTQTVLDAFRQRWLTWDGRADSAWSQALQPIERPHEMGGSRSGAVRLLGEDPQLATLYERAFGPLPPTEWLLSLPAAARPDGPAGADAAWRSLPREDRERIDGIYAHLGKALAAHQLRLSAGVAPLDRFVEAWRRGDLAAAERYPAAAREGLRLFVGRGGCFQCHGGALLSDGEFHSIGTPPRGPLDAADPGRYLGVEILATDPFNAAGPFSDDRDGRAAMLTSQAARGPELWGRFRTPSLRQVAETPPYMHAGQVPDLESVVRFYSTLEGAVLLDHHGETMLAPLGLEEREIASLVAFLESLTGPGPPEPLRSAPIRPDSRHPVGHGGNLP
jgi:cytochrome c peroxidase